MFLVKGVGLEPGALSDSKMVLLYAAEAYSDDVKATRSDCYRFRPLY